MAISLNKTFFDLSKLEPLDGNNFKRWSQKLLIFFEQLEVDYVLFNEPSMNGSNTTIDSSNVMVVDDIAKKKFEKDNRTVRGHLLNHMTNPLFDLFKKYVVGQWIKFQMVDNKPIMEQVHEYENLTADVLNEEMKMCEIFQANVLLEKFPPSWSDYRNQLKHKKKNFTLQEFISHMRTEEANRLKDKMEELSLNSSKVNLVESSGTVVKDRFKGKQKKVEAYEEEKSIQ
ncbi:hypothetical protein R3W88_000704 [Solanum pinnatisectum]|uniref:Uncharacterized protein n=1 Tax=Solanum pinnatisectum TaxID=50273 RepID=A0AAV9MJU8_9SOLN|nr:hypothetical protein R3W88_000704 [Solanum pinnatisectum]